MLTEKDHLLFIAPTAYPLGGVAVWLDYIMTGLIHDKNLTVTFGATSGEYHDVETYLKKYPFSNVEKIDCGTGSVLGRINAIVDVIERVKPTFVICANIPDACLATRQLKRKKTKNFRLIVTIHGLLPRLFADLIEYDDVVDDVVVTNKLTHAMVVKLTNYNNGQIHYAQYGVKNADHLVRDIEDGNELKILYSGRIAFDQKRCQDLIKIAHGLKQDGVKYRLLIAGDGPDREGIMAKLPPQNCEYMGTFLAEDMPEQVYSRADVLLLTSEWETGPIVIWEALAQGLTVVTSRYQGMHTEGALVNGQNCLMFDIGDTDGAVKALRKVNEDGLQERLRQGGLKLIDSRYSREQSINAWWNVLNTIAGSRSSSDLKKIPKPVKLTAQGRLERLIGLRTAEIWRKLFNRKVMMNSAGDEWPHAHSASDPNFVKTFNDSMLTIDSKKLP